jgi:hypothetical protein
MRIALGSFLVAVVLSGLASAATIRGTDRGELLRGTPGTDLILGRGGRDVIEAGRGNDRVAVQYDGARDVVRCGPGRDVVTADRLDRVARDCEVVSRMISRDTYANPESTHETQVEPDAFAFGDTVVTTFQSGRRFDGGASDIGFATSTDGGRTWSSRGLPGVTVNSTPAGTHDRASDPVVAYDARHAVWMISTLALSRGLTELYINRSSDGLRWERPIVAASAATTELAYDKNWLTCDNWPASPFNGRCYLAYTDHTGGRSKFAIRTSSDGGLTWTQAINRPEPGVVGVLPVVRPDGVLVVPYLADDEIRSILSVDGGQTFQNPVTIATFQFRRVESLRSFPLPTADVDAQGRIYVAWQDCRFRSGCAANDIVLATSADGISWNAPVRVTKDGGTDFIPAVAVDPATGRLAMAYHRCGTPCQVEVLLTTSNDGGATWSGPQRLSAQPMPLSWIPRTTSGRMLADYISVSFVRGRTVTVYALASEPRAGELRQAIFATSPLG